MTRGRLALFAGVGPELLGYGVDVKGLALSKWTESARLPGNVQYACSHASGERLYVISSNGGPGVAGDAHQLDGFHIDWDRGVLRPLGDRVPLRHRPIHVATDASSQHILVAYNSPSAVTVHRIERDGSVGVEVGQPASLDTGVFAHQIHVGRSNETAVLVTRGNDPAGGRPEDPGALKVFTYRSGVLANAGSVAPGHGYGFGPRNLDLSPANDWMYVSLERQNRLNVFRVDGDRVHSEPRFVCETLEDPHTLHPKQMAGAIHVHPNGHVVYLANRAFGTTPHGGVEVFAGGENTIAVYRVDRVTGEPRLVQRADTQGIYPRTFSIDPTGRMLVVGNSKPLLVREGPTVHLVAANLAVFSITGDGTLTYVHGYEIEPAREQLFWSGMVAFPAAS